MVEWLPVVVNLLPKFADLLLGVAGLGFALLSRKLSAKYQNEVLDKIIDRASRLAYDVVAELNQTFVGQLKAAAADGKLTRDEAQEASRIALERLKTSMGRKALEELQRQLGSASALNDFLLTKIEASVNGLKSFR